MVQASFFFMSNSSIFICLIADKDKHDFIVPEKKFLKSIGT